MIERHFTVLYGSQTGNAQDVGERIWREGRQYGFLGSALCMDDYPVEKLIFEPLVIFVTSTTGQGEEPDNMKTFWKFLLRKSLPANSLSNLKFAVLGLGDSSYVKFNFVAKRLTRRLTNLGGVALIDSGYADDQHDLGMDAVVDKWIELLWTRLGELFKFTRGIGLPEFDSRWEIKTLDETISSKMVIDVPDRPPQYSQRSPCKLLVLENTRTTTLDHFQDVRYIKFKVPNSLSYLPGDVLMTVPQNSDENVHLLFSIINEGRSQGNAINPCSVVQVCQKENGLPVPQELGSPIRLDECAKKFWDLNAVPRRSTFSILAQLTTDELEKEKLKEFSETGGLEDLYNYCNRPRRTILEVLADFPHTSSAITLDTLFDVLQPIRPRAFSIASSIMMSPGELHILLAVVNYKTKLLKPRQGLCSTYLSELPVGCEVWGWVRGGSFKFPPLGTPVIMVAPGTGVAPFRSYIQELIAGGKACSANLLLFFGCRNENKDFHFASEWKSFRDAGHMKMITAFSRDQSDKIYVQHRIREFGAEVWDKLSRGGIIFVAGSSKNMPSSVRDAFIEVVETHGGLNIPEAVKFVENMERSGKYQTETWS